MSIYKNRLHTKERPLQHLLAQGTPEQIQSALMDISSLPQDLAPSLQGKITLTQDRSLSPLFQQIFSEAFLQEALIKGFEAQPVAYAKSMLEQAFFDKT